MKKILLTLAAVAALASCSKEQTFNAPLSFTATIDNINTKANLGDPEDVYGFNVYPVLWENGDQITVNLMDNVGALAGQKVFTLSSQAGLATGTFVSSDSTPWDPTGVKFIYAYPNPAQGDSIAAIAPVQEYVGEGKAPKGGVTLMAEYASFTDKPTFTKRSALVKVKVSSAPNTTTDIDQIIVNGGSNKPYTLDLGQAISVGSDAKEFFIGVPDGTVVSSVAVQDVTTAVPNIISRSATEQVIARGSTIITVNIKL